MRTTSRMLTTNGFFHIFAKWLLMVHCFLIQGSKIDIKTKKVKAFLKKTFTSLSSLLRNGYFYPLYSSETVSLALPLARRAANTRRPLGVAILERNPCLFFLFRLDGWNVLFIFYLTYFYYYSYSPIYSGCKGTFFFWITKKLGSFSCKITVDAFQALSFFACRIQFNGPFQILERSLFIAF